MIIKNYKTIFIFLLAGLIVILPKNVFTTEQDDNIKYQKIQINKRDKLNEKLPTKGNKGYTFFEDFENGAQDWQKVDETSGESYWHSDTTHSYQGKSWWMGDKDVGTNGGYLNNWYQVLDTPEINLPNSGSLNLSFQQYRAYEPPGTYNNFNGWDGFNVRIRKAGEPYRNSEILTDVTPTYNCSSLYSFGFIHGEDPDGIPGIPGWGGLSGWTETNFTIPDSFRGETIIVSFAFASDGAACTEGDDSNPAHPSWIGLIIDDINVADVFVNNAEDTTGFKAYTPTGGQLWHIYEADNAPSPIHAMGCFDETTGTYNSFMDNFIISPEIELSLNADIWWDTQIKAELDDPANYPDCDYIKVQVRYKENEEWSSWNSISNPLGNSGGTNYVFTGEAPDWVLFSQGFPGFNDMTMLAGKTVQFRIGLKTNRDKPDKFGIRIDNFSVQEFPHYNTPRDFKSAFNSETNTIDLEWKQPLGIVPQDLVYNNPDSIINYISDAQPYAIKAINPYDYPIPLSSINFMLFSELDPPQITGDIEVIVWENDEGVPGDTLLSLRNISDIPSYAYKNVDVSDYNIVIPSNKSVFVGINNFDMMDQGLLVDNSTDLGHSYCFAMGRWITLNEAYGNNINNAMITATIQKRTPETSPVSYKVFRSKDFNNIDNQIANIVDTTYIDHDVEVGQYFYKVSAVYQDGVSETTPFTWSFVESPNSKEMIYDTGDALGGYNAGSSLNKLAVKITGKTDTARVLRLKYYIHEVNSDIIIQIWDSSGKNGLPGNELLAEPVRIDQSNLLGGDWNFFEVPQNENIILEPEQDIYVGWIEVMNNSTIGIDSGSPNFERSYKFSNGEWLGSDMGIPQNFMMRVVIDSLPKLEANFISDITWDTAPFDVTFTDLSRIINDPVTDWFWDFGDGNTSTEKNPIHQYDSVGSFDVSLTVSTSSGVSSTIEKEDYIKSYAPIWPGDTNSDGLVDTLDIDPIAIYMEEQGNKRDNISYSWIRNDYPGGWTQVDAAFADCNGDGVVNLADILAIGVNWQKSHNIIPGSSLNLSPNPEQYRANYLKIYNFLDNSENSKLIKKYLEDILLMPNSNIENSLECYPNPYNPNNNELTIEYSLKQNFEHVSIKLFNIKGQLIKKFDNLTSDKSNNTIRWYGNDTFGNKVSSGIYFYKLSAGSKNIKIEKFILVK